MPRVERPRASLIAAAVAFVIVGLVFLIGLFGSLTKTNGGEVAVVRNGGPFDDHKIRQEIDPASGLTWTGWGSQVQLYPAQQRFYTITSNAERGDRTGVDVVHTPTSDGVSVGIEGTIYFTLNLDHAALAQFDNRYGTRKFRGLDGVVRYAWDGDDGWSGFLDQVVRPVIDNDLREQIAGFRCSELVSSCALVQNARTQPAAVGANNNG